MATRIIWRGITNFQRGLLDFEGKVHREVVRGAIGKAARPVIRQVKKNARAIKRTGILGTSIGIRVRTYDEIVLALVGARRGFQRFDKRGNKHVPSKTGHLPERGFFHVKGRKKVAGKKWLERGVKDTEAEYERILAEQMEAQFERALRRTTRRFQRQLDRI